MKPSPKIDLFAPLIAEKKWHPNFRSMLGPDLAANRRVLINWAEDFVDRDGKFVQEFQRTFNSGFWELYLFACCKELGLKVDFSFAAPDFVISNFHNEFCIEAVIASNAQGEKAEWEKDLKALKSRPNLEGVLDTAVIRLSNAIKSKHGKFLASYQGMPHVKKRPFVIAVAPFEQPSFNAHNDHAIRQVLYGYDRIGADGNHVFRKAIAKKSGATIGLGLFTTPKMPEISAVLYSNTATMSKVWALNGERDEMMWFSALRFNHHGPQPILENCCKNDYQESLLDGLYVFHNRHATYPLPFKYFNHDDITQGALMAGSDVPRYKCKHRSLIQRSSFRLRPKPETESQPTQ